MGQDVDIRDLLRSLGFETEEAAAAARAVLEDRGLTRPHKTRIAAAKRDAVAALLALRVARVCSAPECAASAAGRTPVVVRQQHCEHCAGSAHARATRRLSGFTARLVRPLRLVVVGGSPATRVELRGVLPAAGVDARLVDGTRGRRAAQAAGDLAWADLVLIWGPTILDHKVSQLYTGGTAASTVVVTVRHRGIEALLDAAADHLQRRLDADVRRWPSSGSGAPVAQPPGADAIALMPARRSTRRSRGS